MAMARWELRETPPSVPTRSGHAMVLGGRRLYLISGRAGCAPRLWRRSWPLDRLSPGLSRWRSGRMGMQVDEH